MQLSRLRPLGQPLVRRFSSAAGAPTGMLGRLGARARGLLTSRVTLPLPFVLAGAYAGNDWMQKHFGSAENFFEGKFVTDKDPEAIAEFYQAEDLLRIIAMHDFLFNLFMDKVEPDPNYMTEETALLSVNETHMNVKLLGLEVSFEIIEHEEETADGESRLGSFIRHERFIDWVPLLADFGIKIPLWDQTWNYSFTHLDDGKIEVSHRCERFQGPWPIRLVIFFHQYYVLWACDKYINSSIFGTDDFDRQQEVLANIPQAIVNRFIFKVKEAKQRLLEARRNEVVPDEAAIAEVTAEIEALEAASGSKGSIAIAKRTNPVNTSFAGREAASTKLIVGDEATQKAMAVALKDAKGNREISAAMKELVKESDLQWQERPVKTKTGSKARKKTTDKGGESS